MKPVNEKSTFNFHEEIADKKQIYTYRFIEDMKGKVNLDSQFSRLAGLLLFNQNGIEPENFEDRDEKDKQNYKKFMEIVDTKMIACRMDEIRTAQHNEILAESEDYEQKPNRDYLDRYFNVHV